MKIRPVGVNLFPADKWTDMMKPIVPFCNFANVPKMAHLQNSTEISYA
jgi:hypothetical protein